MKIMESETLHTVTIDACLSPFEKRESYIARCKVWLKSKRRCFPWFLPIFHKTATIGEAEITLTHDRMPFPIQVKLPKVRREMDFDVFVSMPGRQYIVTEPVIVVTTPHD